jgi:hypothetical protein
VDPIADIDFNPELAERFRDQTSSSGPRMKVSM